MLLVLMAVVGLLLLISFLVLPKVYRQFQNTNSALQRQKQFTQDVTKYTVDLTALDLQSQTLLRSSLTKVQTATTLAQKSDLTAAQKTQIQTLLAQAIKDAKEVAATNPQNPVAWIRLGDIYAYLIDVVDGADTWAVSSYQKAISLSPDIYLYHEKLGGIYYRTKNYESAITEFQKVTTLSPAYPNGYYNLGLTYKSTGAKAQAREALQKALDLLPSVSPDKVKVEKELQTLGF
jgi:tetratricopeptide (TPR) repeat protein